MLKDKLLSIVKKNGSTALIALVAFGAIFFYKGGYFSKKASVAKRDDFVIAERLYESLQKGEPIASESVEIVEKLLQRHPELHAKLDAPLALAFLAEHNIAKNIFYTEKLLKRASPQLPHPYVTFAKIALLISKENYQEALERTLELKQDLSSQEGYTILSGLNELRLLFLAEKRGNLSLRDEAWHSFKQHPSYPTLSPLFQEGQVSLADIVN